MTRIIGISGAARSGKTTLASRLSEYRSIGFADALKREVRESCRSPLARMLCRLAERDVTWAKRLVRPRYIQHGERRRRENAAYWLDKVVREIDDGGKWVVCDVRYANEAAMLKNKFNAKIIMLTRKTAVNDIPSEIVSLGEMRRRGLVDFVVENDGTVEELVEKVRRVL